MVSQGHELAIAIFSKNIAQSEVDDLEAAGECVVAVQ